MKRKVLFISLLLFALLMGYQNCSNVRLKEIVPSHNVTFDGKFCVEPPESQTRYSKILFIVDKSDSNELFPGSDPNSEMRAGSIQDFFNQRKINPFYKWGYIAFNGEGEDSAKAFVNRGSDREPMFGNAQQMQEAIDRQRRDPDDGCTPYIEALDMARVAIEQDVEEAREKGEEAIYNIFFLSDGMPNMEGCGDGWVNDNPKDPILQRVRNVVNVSPGKIFLSTVYYYPKGGRQDKAASGLSYMARDGGGLFTDLGDKKKIDFKEIDVGKFTDPWIIKKMVTFNLNAGFCDDGLIDIDSDSDGLCDRDEYKLNEDPEIKARLKKKKLEGKKFEPQNRNSILKEISDLFAYRYIISDREIALCNKIKPDQDFDLLNSCEEELMKDDLANGPVKEWTDEFRGHGNMADKKNPDSDGDGFIDLIEYFTFARIEPSAPVSYEHLFDTYGPSDDFTSETIMQHHYNPKGDFKFNEHNYDSYLRPLGLNVQDRYCYDYQQTQLAIYNTKGLTLEQAGGNSNLVHADGENVILVYYISTKHNDENGKGVYFYSFQKSLYGEGNRNHVLNLKNFKQYSVPKIRMN